MPGGRIVDKNKGGGGEETERSFKHVVVLEHKSRRGLGEEACRQVEQESYGV